MVKLIQTKVNNDKMSQINENNNRGKEISDKSEEINMTVTTPVNFSENSDQELGVSFGVDDGEFGGVCFTDYIS